jgi:hypothetical protein
VTQNKVIVDFFPTNTAKPFSSDVASMGQILEFLRPTDSFDPEVLEILGNAYDMAMAALHDAGQPEVVREVFARRIIRAAKKGECDPAKLCGIALSAFNSDRLIR